MSENRIRRPESIAELSPSFAIDFKYQQRLTARRPSGSHKKSLLDVSKEVDSIRPYAPEDPVRLIDWKAFARTDQLLIREVREQSSADVQIIIDGSPSMQWPEVGVAPQIGPKKAEIALRLGLHLAFSHLRQGDLVNIWYLEDSSEIKRTRRFRPRSSGDLLNLFYDLEKSGYLIDQVLSYFPLIPEQPQRMSDLVIWLGDGLTGNSHVNALTQGRKSLFVHVLSRLELDDEWLEGGISYADMLPQPGKEFLGSTLRDEHSFLAKVSAWRRGLEAAITSHGGGYMLVHDELPLMRYFALLAEFHNSGVVR